MAADRLNVIKLEATKLGDHSRIIMMIRIYLRNKSLTALLFSTIITINNLKIKLLSFGSDYNLIDYKRIFGGCTWVKHVELEAT